MTFVAGEGAEGQKWCKIIEALSSDPPVAIETVLPQLRMRNELPIFSTVQHKIELERVIILRNTAKCVLNFYLRRAMKISEKQPLVWLCEYELARVRVSLNRL